MTHICVGNLTIIGSDNGLSAGRHQAITWTNAGKLLIGPLGTNFSEILIEIQTFLLKKRNLKMSSVKWRPFCLGLNVLMVNCSTLWGHMTHGNSYCFSKVTNGPTYVTQANDSPSECPNSRQFACPYRLCNEAVKESRFVSSLNTIPHILLPSTCACHIYICHQKKGYPVL